MTTEQLNWTFVHFDRITPGDLYDLIVLRQRVFVVEQHCAFLDADGIDRFSWHLLGRLPGTSPKMSKGVEYPVPKGCLWQRDAYGKGMPTAYSTHQAQNPLLVYLRIVPPGDRFEEPSIGRVVTAPEVRGTGLGRILMLEGIRLTKELYPGQPIKLSAQIHLKNFYGSLGFTVSGEPYEEDGIPHIDMRRSEL